MRRVWLVLALIGMLSVSACSVMTIRTVRGSGDVVSEPRSVEGFSRVAISGIGTLYIEQGDREALVIEAEDNILPYLESEVRNNTLELGVQITGLNLRPTERIEYYLTVRDLEQVEASGTADVYILSLTTSEFQIEISGLGDVTVDALFSDSVRTDISGSGDVRIAGEVADQEVQISGLGNYDAGDLESDVALIVMSGSASATVWAKESLDVRISGVGDVEYYGSPQVRQQISGLGSLLQLGDR